MVFWGVEVRGENVWRHLCVGPDGEVAFFQKAVLLVREGRETLLAILVTLLGGETPPAQYLSNTLDDFLPDRWELVGKTWCFLTDRVPGVQSEAYQDPPGSGCLFIAPN